MTCQRHLKQTSSVHMEIEKYNALFFYPTPNRIALCCYLIVKSNNITAVYLLATSLWHELSQTMNLPLNSIYLNSIYLTNVFNINVLCAFYFHRPPEVYNNLEYVEDQDLNARVQCYINIFEFM